MTALGGISWELFKQGSQHFRHSSEASNLLDMTSLLSVGCNMQLNTAQKCVKRVLSAKKSNNSATVKLQLPIFAKIRSSINCWVAHTLPFFMERVSFFFYMKCNAVSKASSNFLNEEYWQRFRIKWRGVSPSPTIWGASCFLSLFDTHFHIHFRNIVYTLRHEKGPL